MKETNLPEIERTAYCTSSYYRLMGGSLGNKNADKILKYLQEKETRSATKANIQQECFSNHLKKSDADSAWRISLRN